MLEALGQDAPTATFIPPHQLPDNPTKQRLGPPYVRPTDACRGHYACARGAGRMECGADQMKAQHVLTHFKAEGSPFSS